MRKQGRNIQSLLIIDGFIHVRHAHHLGLRFEERLGRANISKSLNDHPGTFDAASQRTQHLLDRSGCILSEAQHPQWIQAPHLYQFLFAKNPQCAQPPDAILHRGG